eukprot:Gb_19006 [translate_table: standard]
MASDEVFKLTSPVLEHGGRIPRKYTADGPGPKKDFSPPLEWYGVPEGTKSLALIMDDPDAPDPDDPIVPWTHWVLINIPPTLKRLSEDFSVKQFGENSEYASIKEGYNDWKVPGYRGPNPPVGNHRYVFRLYALDDFMNIGNKITKEKLLEAMQAHILGVAEMVCYFSKEKIPTGRDSFMPAGKPDPNGPGFPDIIKFPNRGTKTHRIYNRGKDKYS